MRYQIAGKIGAQFSRPRQNPHCGFKATLEFINLESLEVIASISVQVPSQILAHNVAEAIIRREMKYFQHRDFNPKQASLAPIL